MDIHAPELAPRVTVLEVSVLCIEQFLYAECFHPAEGFLSISKTLGNCFFLIVKGLISASNPDLAYLACKGAGKTGRLSSSAMFLTISTSSPVHRFITAPPAIRFEAFEMCEPAVCVPALSRLIEICYSTQQGNSISHALLSC